METRNITLYAFDELCESAKAYARKQFKDEAYENAVTADREDADTTLDKLTELTGCRFRIDSSSQGFCVKVIDEKYIDCPDYDDANDDRRFERFKKKLAQLKKELWTDYILQEVAESTDYPRNRWSNYAYALEKVVERFCDRIYSQSLAYMEDDYIDDYIQSQDGICFIGNGARFNY